MIYSLLESVFNFLLEYEIGDVFVIFWAIFIILFIITFSGPKKNFIKTIGYVMSNEKNSFIDNYMLNVIKWFSILVLISAVITIVQENFGIITEPPNTSKMILYYFSKYQLHQLLKKLGLD